MVSDAMLAAYRRIIQNEFKSVRVSVENGFSEEYGVFINAIGIPDERRAQFSRFILDTLAPLIEEQGFEFIGVVPYSLDEAKSKYPDVWSEIQEEAANAAGRSVFRKTLNGQDARVGWEDPVAHSDAVLR